METLEKLTKEFCNKYRFQIKAFMYGELIGNIVNAAMGNAETFEEMTNKHIRLPSSEEGECLYMLSNSIAKKKKAIKERQEGTFHSHITYWETINDLNEKISRVYEDLISIHGYSLVKNKK